MMTITNEEHLSRTCERLEYFEAEIARMRIHLADNPSLNHAIASHERMCQQLRVQIRTYENTRAGGEMVASPKPIYLKGRVENGRLVLAPTNSLPVKENEIWVAGLRLVIDLEEAD